MRRRSDKTRPSCQGHTRENEAPNKEATQLAEMKVLPQSLETNYLEISPVACDQASQTKNYRLLLKSGRARNSKKKNLLVLINTCHVQKQQDI